MSIDDYIAGFPRDVQEVLKKIRATIRKAVPKAVEAIKYKMPAYVLDGKNLVIERGEMQPAGLREVERAQQDGRWEAAYDSPRTAAVPDDLAAALEAKPRAKAFFAQLSSANRYAILWRLQTAKKSETRARRIGLFVEMLGRGETLH